MRDKRPSLHRKWAFFNQHFRTSFEMHREISTVATRVTLPLQMDSVLYRMHFKLNDEQPFIVQAQLI